MKRKGFTLVELLVVLVLLGAVTALVAPALMGQVERMRERNVAAELQAVLSAMPLRARQLAAETTVDERALTAMVDLPPNWRVRVPTALHYTAGGVASGGRVHLHDPFGPVGQWTVAPLTGAVTRAPAP